jgi:hypothetical protein
MPAIQYVSNVADDRFQTVLEVAPDGAGRLSIGSNRDRRDVPIGRFEGALPPPLREQLASATSDPAFRESPSQDMLMPDESYRQIRVDADGATLVKRIGEELAAPPAFLAVEAALARAIDHLLASPVVAMDVAVAGLPQRISAGSQAPLELVIQNRGTRPYALPGPSRWGAKGIQCELVATRSDIPLERLGIEHQRFVQLDATRADRALASELGDTIELAPGARVTVRFQPTFDWPAGAYRVEVSLTVAVAGTSETPALEGGLVTAPRMLEIEG